MLTAKIRYYKVNKFGFYNRGQELMAFGSIIEHLRELHAWGNDGRELVNTKTYEANPDLDILNTYYSGMHADPTTNDVVLVLWNEIPNTDGTIYGINPNQPPGTIEMLHSGFQGPAIPGLPSYFWYMHSEGMIASIKFSHSMQGGANLEKYLTGFLANKSRYRVIDGDEVVGFSHSGIYCQHCESVYPKFKITPARRNVLLDELLTNVHRISRIIKKEKLDYHITDQRNAIQRLFSGLLNNMPQFIEDRTITHSFPFRPTESQLMEMVNNFFHADDDSPLVNLGFILSDGRVIMLGGMYINLKYEFDITLADNQMVSPRQLLDTINVNRDNLLRPLR